MGLSWGRTRPEGGASWPVPGRAAAVTTTSWLGETTTQEVSWAEALTPAAAEADGGDLELQFSAMPDALEIWQTGGDGQRILAVHTPQETCVLEAGDGTTYTITGSWTIGRTVYEMEFAEIVVGSRQE